MEGVEAADAADGDEDAAAAAADGAEAMEGVEAAADAAGGDADAAAAAAAAAVANGDTEAAEAAEEVGGDAAAADGAAADGKAAWTPSWVRGGGGRGRGDTGRFRGIDPIIPVEDPAIIQMLVDFYGVSDALLSVLLADVRESLKIPATGLKLFERHELRGKEEGLPFLLPHLTRQVLRLPVADLMRLLADRNVPLLIPSSANGSAQETAAAAAAAKTPSKQVRVLRRVLTMRPRVWCGCWAWRWAFWVLAASVGSRRELTAERFVPLSTPSVLRQLEALESGGAVAMLDEEAAQQLGLATDEAGSGALTANAPLAVSVWRTRASLSVLVAKVECEQMADKLRHAQQQMKQQQQQQGEKGKAAVAEKQTEAVAA
ncbi:hypothetical protein COO60DRAFT_1644813 [Scenedesmus sp. NREL 46B-D3]|nr:hypothetical protein COO60DRAFT_1644813 [Scenedesmus sp. NREL 46B-D3]